MCYTGCNCFEDRASLFSTVSFAKILRTKGGKKTGSAVSVSAALSLPARLRIAPQSPGRLSGHSTGRSVFEHWCFKLPYLELSSGRRHRELQIFINFDRILCLFLLARRLFFFFFKLSAKIKYFSLHEENNLGSVYFTLAFQTVAFTIYF